MLAQIEDVCCTALPHTVSSICHGVLTTDVKQACALPATASFRCWASKSAKASRMSLYRAASAASCCCCCCGLLLLGPAYVTGRLSALSAMPVMSALFISMLLPRPRCCCCCCFSEVLLAPRGDACAVLWADSGLAPLPGVAATGMEPYSDMMNMMMLWAPIQQYTDGQTTDKRQKRQKPDQLLLCR